jgi:hypothetical protein
MWLKTLPKCKASGKFSILLKMIIVNENENENGGATI